MTAEQPELVPGGSRHPSEARSVHPWLLVPALVALWCVGGFFIAAAFYGFVTGFWQLLVFFGGILHYGMAAVAAESFANQLGRATAALFAPIFFGTVGSLCVVAAKRIGAGLARARERDDTRAPVIYLRSFTVDKPLSRRPRALGRVFSSRTEEEQLAEALREMGPVVAIGRPGERLPRLGAARIYVEDADWQQQILAWFKRAALVVIHVPPNPTMGVAWETDRSLSTVALPRLVFLLGRESTSLEWLTHKLQEHGLTIALPQKLPRGPYRSSSSGIVYFTDGKHAQFTGLFKPPFFRRPFSQPLVPVYRLALKPVIERLAGVWRPLPLAFGDASIAAVWITFCVVVLVFGLYMRRTALVERETMILTRELRNELPAEALQSVRGLDQAGVSAWIRSQFTIGLRYAPDEAVTAQADIMRRLLAAAPAEQCAAIANGTVTEPVLRSRLNELGMADPAALRAWVAFRRHALTESVASTHAAAFPLSNADVLEAFARLYEKLPAADGERFGDIAGRYESANTQDQCWFARTLLGGVGLLHEPSRTKLARAALGQDPDR
jgi:hypothetical protein